MCPVGRVRGTSPLSVDSLLRDLWPFPLGSLLQEHHGSCARMSWKHSWPALGDVISWVVCMCVCLGGSVVKNPPASAGEAGSIPGSGRSPGEENSNPLQYCLENPMDREPGRLQSIGSQSVGHDWPAEHSWSSLPSAEFYSEHVFLCRTCYSIAHIAESHISCVTHMTLGQAGGWVHRPWLAPGSPHIKSDMLPTSACLAAYFRASLSKVCSSCILSVKKF